MSTHMARRLVSLAALAALLLAAPAARAQGGNGLYEPFPDDVRKGQAVLFVEALGFGERTSVTREQLEAGRFLERPSSAGGGASVRAGLRQGDEDDLSAGVQLLLVLGALGFVALIALRPRRRVAAR